MPTLILDLYWADHNELHSDIVIRIGAELIVADSYWLATNSRVQADARKKYYSLWRAAAQRLASLPDGGECFLPIRYDDESATWIRFSRIRDVVEASVGWTDEPAPVALSRRNPVPDTLEGWTPSEREAVQGPREDFIAALQSIGNLHKGTAPP